MRLEEPRPGATYPQLLRREPFDAVRPLLALMLGILGYAVVPVVAQAVLALSWALSGRPESWPEWVRAGLAFERPDGMLATHLGLAVLIPVTLLVLAVVGRLAPRWVHSVQPGFRWRYAVVVGIAALVLLALALLLTRRHDLAAATPQPGYWWFLLVVVLTSPLQAAGEEYLFRGLLLTTLGAYLRSPWFGIVASATVFALFHGVQNPALFLDRFAFGVVAGVLVWRTGGLEAGIAIHAANNVLAFATAGLFGTIAGVRATQVLGWTEAAIDVATFVVVALAAWWLARRFRLAVTTPGSAGEVLQPRQRVR